MPRLKGNQTIALEARGQKDLDWLRAGWESLLLEYACGSVWLIEFPASPDLPRRLECLRPCRDVVPRAAPRGGEKSRRSLRGTRGRAVTAGEEAAMRCRVLLPRVRAGGGGK
jgi:hypothetical protein